jgi:hypothetical protein
MNALLLHTIIYARSHPVTKCRDESIIFLLYPIESYNSAFNLIFEYNLSTIDGSLRVLWLLPTLKLVALI